MTNNNLAPKKSWLEVSTNMSGIETGSLPSLSFKNVNYDAMLTKLGEFGRFQKKALLWLWLPAFVAGIVSFFSFNKTTNPSLLQVVVTSEFSLAGPDYDGFYCADTSICSGNSTDRFGNVVPNPKTPDTSPRFPTPFVRLAKEPNYFR